MSLTPAQAALVALLVLPAGALGAAPTCAPREQVIRQLAERYGETRHSMGLGGTDAMMELFASDQTGTWTITVTNARGVTCLVASGQAFETVADTAPARGPAL